MPTQAASVPTFTKNVKVVQPPIAAQGLKVVAAIHENLTNP